LSLKKYRRQATTAVKRPGRNNALEKIDVDGAGSGRMSKMRGPLAEACRGISEAATVVLMSVSAAIGILRNLDFAP
jgi:hypothetical protein